MPPSKTRARKRHERDVANVTFNGLSLASRPGRVMTPRRATEQLVRAALDRIGSDPARVVDVGTGVGAIAVAIADAAPNAHVFATDTSRCAIALARANVRRHGLVDRVTLRHGDLLEPVPGEIDLVVANLPYLPAVDAERYPDLAREPAPAIFAAGDGLEPYRRPARLLRRAAGRQGRGSHPATPSRARGDGRRAGGTPRHARALRASDPARAKPGHGLAKCQPAQDAKPPTIATGRPSPMAP
jgi:SAM-dependent methyltransferase